jgi:hypothetical protein
MNEPVWLTTRWRVGTNRHPNCDGSPWGWVQDDGDTKHIFFWTGDSKQASEICSFHNRMIEELLKSRTAPKL